eukprot:8687513-Alexandrium_andersonii.AAC.1
MLDSSPETKPRQATALARPTDHAVPVHGSESAQVRAPEASVLGAGGAALRATPPASGSALWGGGAPTFAGAEPWTRPLGPLRALSPRPPHASFGAT